MFEMYFICPTLFLIFSLSITEKIPTGANVDIFQIHADDISRISSENRNYLRRKVLIHFGLALIITLEISIMFCIFADTNLLLSLTLSNVLSLSIGLAAALLPLRKVANQLKKK
ncbi:hypothetical protein [Zhenhengia yiwuensis]|uniref:Uncharacterized protein n=1 Tax=Zhenhengia yiwuensis TaxID=2763666 RepID=A0A926EI94_9FIRM|nr:hypothetical protein [Zhenhengia yiwuensis]MBC8580879.1 hypothetical protein [Zhenhengia yiwuensis]